MKRPSRHNPSIGRTAFAALCALVLAGCGTERADGDRSAAAAPQSAHPESTTSAAPEASESIEPEDIEDTGGPDFLPFMQLLVDLGEPCLPSDLPTALSPEELEELEGLETAAPTAFPSGFPSQEPVPLPVSDEPVPTGEPRSPEDDLKELELSSIEKCDARIHERRITKALQDQGGQSQNQSQGQGTDDPAPAQVGSVLRGLGYIDERVYGPQRNSESVEFTLDLRLLGGGPCLTGRINGTEVIFEAYGGHPEVDCQDVRLDER